MIREQVLYCFSALTWNLELLCTLSFKSGALVESSTTTTEGVKDVDEVRSFVNTEQYLNFVQTFLQDFEEYVTALILAKIVPVSGVLPNTPFATPTSEKDRVGRLLREYPTFVFHTSRALKPGDARRRTAQHIVRNVYLSGKHPALQPLLLEFLGIYRIVQAYTGAELQKTNSAASLRYGLLSWAPIPWPTTTTATPSSTTAPAGGCWGASSLKLHNHHQGESNDPQAPTRGLLFMSHLPVSKLPIVKLVIPAIDDDTYDLSQHFYEDDIFSFMSGTLVPNNSDGTSTNERTSPLATSRGLTLVHCSAGMHRSPAFIVAFMIREHIRAGDPVDAESGKMRTVDDWCEFIKTRRSVSMPTDVAKAQLNEFLQSLRSAQLPSTTPFGGPARSEPPPQQSAAQHLRQLQNRSPPSAATTSSPVHSIAATTPSVASPLFSGASPPLAAASSGHSTPAAVPSSPWLTAAFRGQQHLNEVPAVSLSVNPSTPHK
ncbi:dual specificity protein phosphatase, putative [Bodo saltans]|uniref:Dual specificity protein phosphatase, putative n=1 Tax=Bodo saltans TaxID=75058 RepID=A0A0S4IV02_BODSA|nr:dual specificity protein phosphatase, putative [Bodo saltans]|eukprot:CUG14408.1 dual specificity protein phosphatase, putative [Bodo saltans]